MRFDIYIECAETEGYQCIEFLKTGGPIVNIFRLIIYFADYLNLISCKFILAQMIDMIINTA